jgi:hypothetical protein
MMSLSMNLKDGEPCSHNGCLRHITHPCEGCGRVAGVSVPFQRWNELNEPEIRFTDEPAIRLMYLEEKTNE